MQHTIYIHKLTAFNLWFVLPRLLFCNVVAWRIILPRIICTRCELMMAYKLFARDEWLLLQEGMFVKWRDDVYPQVLEKVNKFTNYAGLKIEFEKNLLQHLSIELEELLSYVEVAKRHAKVNGINKYTIYISSYLARMIGRDLLKEVSPDDNIKISRGLTVANSIYELWITFLYYGREMFAISYSLIKVHSAKKNSTYKILWSGISPQEIPGSDNKLNFSWAADYGMVEKSDVMYVLPIRPTKIQQEYLTSKNINYIDPFSRYSALDMSTRLGLMLTLSIAMLKTISPPFSMQRRYIQRYLIRSEFWIELAKKLKSELYITSASYSWPERPEVAALNALNLKTIIWMYSANSIQFTNNHPEFNDYKVERCVIVSSEYWVWNDAFRKLLKKRAIHTTEDITRRIKYKVMGSMMCGDPRTLSKTKTEVRRSIELDEKGIYITVFDVSLMGESWFRKFSRGPSFLSQEYANAFFKGIKRILEEYPDINILIKRKRKESIYAPFCSELTSLLDENSEWFKSGRIIELDPYVDPYIPIAVADGCIGMPFTSPILSALSIDRFGIYYDPLNMANYPTEEQYSHILIHSEEELLSRIGEWLKEERLIDKEKFRAAIPPSRMYDRVKKDLCKIS